MACALLCQSLFLGKRVPPQLANILSGVSNDPDQLITVATMQIPVFAPDFVSPHYGYRSFGPIGVQTIEFELPPPL